MTAAGKTLCDRVRRAARPIRCAGLIVLALLGLAGCASSAVGPGDEECRQVDVLRICPTDSSRVDTTSS